MSKNQEINTMFGKYDCAGSKKKGGTIMSAPTKTKRKRFDSTKQDSRIRSANSQGSEQALGCFSQS